MNAAKELEALQARVAECERQIADLRAFQEKAMRLIPELNKEQARKTMEQAAADAAVSKEFIVVGGNNPPPTEDTLRYREEAAARVRLPYAQTVRDEVGEYLKRPLPPVFSDNL